MRVEGCFVHLSHFAAVLRVEFRSNLSAVSINRVLRAMLAAIYIDTVTAASYTVRHDTVKCIKP